MYCISVNYKFVGMKRSIFNLSEIAYRMQKCVEGTAQKTIYYKLLDATSFGANKFKDEEIDKICSIIETSSKEAIAYLKGLKSTNSEANK